MRILATVAAVLLVGIMPESRGASPSGAPQERPEMLAAPRALLRDLVAIDTSAPNGSTTPAAERAAAHLRAAGLPDAAGAVWPGVPVMPVMETGGTDGLSFRERGTLVYGLNHFQNPNDSRAHGRDERIGVRQFDEAARFGYELARRVGRVESP